MSQLEKRALSTAEASTYIGISQSTLRQARMTGKRAKRIDAPPHTRLGGRKVVYLREDLDAWLESHRTATGGAV